jgi:hypothetical protein
MTLLQDLHHDTPPGMPHPIGQKPIGSKADRVVGLHFRGETGEFCDPSSCTLTIAK